MTPMKISLMNNYKYNNNDNNNNNNNNNNNHGLHCINSISLKNGITSANKLQNILTSRLMELD